MESNINQSNERYSKKLPGMNVITPKDSLVTNRRRKSLGDDDLTLQKEEARTNAYFEQIQKLLNEQMIQSTTNLDKQQHECNARDFIDLESPINDTKCDESLV